ncbi:YIP1 family protein, partial [Mycobacteroides abscessus subsp. abscessus]
ATAGVIVGAWGMWFTFRGGYGTWWHQISGETGWSLMLGVGQMLVAVLAGAALFTGGKYLAGLVKDALIEAGVLAEHDRAGHGNGAPSHPALLATL